MLAQVTQLGGPGPVTMAFRQMLRRPLPLAAGAIATCFHGAPPPQLAPHGNVRRGSSKGRKHRTGTNEVSTDKPPSRQTTKTVLTALPPSGLSNTMVKEDDLVRYLSAGELDQSLRIWSDFVVATDSFRDLKPETYEAISNFVVDILSRKNGLDIGKWAARDPQQLETLLHMAVEAAVHDSWRGFNALQLELIGAGRPHDIVSAYERFKDRLFAHQGKDPKDLQSWYREKRLAARLTGDGLIPLMLGYVAAQTMLGQFDHTALISLMDSSYDARLIARDRLDLSAMSYHIKSRANSGASDAVWSQFLANIDKVTLAIQCYHPKALVTRIRALARHGDRSKVDWLYEQLMKASIGSDRFVIPIDSGNRSANYNFVPLGMEVWGELALTRGS